ncbi:MAG: Zn-ribbon domain-containing OB-fold protein [Solirubrobacteraceae bacterium]
MSTFVRGGMDWEHGTAMMVGPWQLGHADPSPETLEYWRGVERDELLIKRCTGCGRHHHPRRILCYDCGSDRLKWIRSEGPAEVYTFSVVHRGPTDALQAETPYTVGIVRLPEGVFFFARLSPGDGTGISVGAQAELGFEEIGAHGKLPVFRVGS